MRTVIGTFLLLTTAVEISAQEELSTDLGRWLATLPLDARSADEMGRFTHDETELSEGYRSALVASMRGLIVMEADQAVSALLLGACEPSVEVTYPRKDDNDQEVEAEKEFSKSFIRTEMFACFKTEMDDPTAALDIYTDGDFRKETSSRIEEVWAEGDRSCVETGRIPALLSPTKSCNSISSFSESRMAAEHSQVVWNEGKNPYQDVYYKESVKTFVQIPGGLALHYLNYSRTTHMGRAQRWFGTGRIEDSQRASAEMMARRLRFATSGLGSGESVSSKDHQLRSRFWSLEGRRPRTTVRLAETPR